MKKKTFDSLEIKGKLYVNFKEKNNNLAGNLYWFYDLHPR